MCGIGSSVISSAARKRKVFFFQDKLTILYSVFAGEKEECRYPVQYPSDLPLNNSGRGKEPQGREMVPFQHTAKVMLKLCL